MLRCLFECVRHLQHADCLFQIPGTESCFEERLEVDVVDAGLNGIDQSDIDLVRRDRRAWIKIYGDSEITRRSYVADVAPKNRDEIPAELSNLAGGEIATKQDEKTGKVEPLTAVYEVIIPIDNRNLALQPGLRGFAKIDGGTHTLGWWLWRLITKTFHFTL